MAFKYLIDENSFVSSGGTSSLLELKDYKAKHGPVRPAFLE